MVARSRGMAPAVLWHIYMDIWVILVLSYYCTGVICVKRWLVRRWVIPLAIAAGVGGLIWLVFLPSFNAGRAVAVTMLEHRREGSPFPWTDLFAQAPIQHDAETLAAFSSLSGIDSFAFRAYERSETGRMTLEYEVFRGNESQFVTFILVSTEQGWRISQLRVE